MVGWLNLEFRVEVLGGICEISFFSEVDFFGWSRILGYYIFSRG